MLQRVLEIEAYRMMALLAFPLVPPLSVLIADAERALTALTVELTSPGANDDILLQRLTELAAQYRGTVKGRLNMGCLLTFAQILVPQLRRSFITRYPEVDFRQSETHQAGLIEGLRDATLDVALTYDLALPADLEFVELATLPPFVLLAENHPLSRLKSVSVADLTDLPLVLLDLPLSADYFLSFFEKPTCQLAK